MGWPTGKAGRAVILRVHFDSVAFALAAVLKKPELPLWPGCRACGNNQGSFQEVQVRL
jgi:hypothetical protein